MYDFIGLILVRVPREEPRTMRRWIHDQFCKNTSSAPDIHSIVVFSLAQQNFRRAVPTCHYVLRKQLSALAASEPEIADANTAVLVYKSEDKIVWAWHVVDKTRSDCRHIANINQRNHKQRSHVRRLQVSVNHLCCVQISAKLRQWLAIVSLYTRAVPSIVKHHTPKAAQNLHKNILQTLVID